MLPMKRWTIAVSLALLAAVAVEAGEPTITEPGAPTRCNGDCNGDRSTRIDEITLGMNILLDRRSLDDCPAFDADDNAGLHLTDLLQAVNSALLGCPPVQAPD